jgi:hypothetical protein
MRREVHKHNNTKVHEHSAPLKQSHQWYQGDEGIKVWQSFSNRFSLPRVVGRKKKHSHTHKNE